MKKRSKKWWALTERQRRHDKSVKRSGWFRSVPWDYRHYQFVVPWRARCKAELKKAVRDGDFENVCFPPFKKDAGWTYW